MLQALVRMFPENMLVPAQLATASTTNAASGGAGAAPAPSVSGSSAPAAPAPATTVAKEARARAASATSASFGATAVAAFSTTAAMINGAAEMAAADHRTHRASAQQHPAAITAGEMTPGLMLASAMHTFPSIEQLCSLTEEQVRVLVRPCRVQLSNGDSEAMYTRELFESSLTRCLNRVLELEHVRPSNVFLVSLTSNLNLLMTPLHSAVLGVGVGLSRPSHDQNAAAVGGNGWRSVVGESEDAVLR